MSVYLPKKSPYWAYDFQLKGRRYHGSTGVETRRAAEQVERNIRVKAALGELDDAGDMTLDVAAGRWWQEVGQHRSSAYQLEHRLEIACRLLGPRTKIRDITTKAVSIAIEKRRGETFTRAEDQPATKDRPARKAKRYTLSNATVNADVARPIRRILNRARKVWEVKNLPEIDWASLTLKEPETEIRLYSDAQQTAWLGQCDETARFALRLLLTYGLRFGELFFPLEAYAPDTPHGPSLAVNKRKRGALYLPLRDDDARMIAARVGRARAGGMPSIWFEVGPGRKLVAVTYLGLKARLRSAARRAGLNMPRLVHGIRHHVGTSNLAATGDLRMTQSLLGHADIKSTLIYAHALDNGLRAALNSRNSPGAPDPDAEFSVPKQRRRRKTP